MASYYLNTNRQTNGDYEVHESGCTRMPNESNREYLGNFSDCKGAVAAAKQRHPYWHRINGCYWCARTCHTT